MSPLATIPREMVGLSVERPLRFCTMHWGEVRLGWIQPGDDLDPPSEGLPGHRAIELFTPQPRWPYHIALHKHDFYEIVIVRGGRGIHVTPASNLPLKRGEVFILTPKAVHGFREISGLVKTNFYLLPDWLQENLKPLFREEGLSRFLFADTLLAHSNHEGVLHLTVTEEELLSCEGEIAVMMQEALQPKPSLTLLNACFLKVLWVLNKAYKRSDRRPDVSVRPEVWTALERIHRAVQDCRPINVSALASELGLSKSSLFRLFKEASGKSPMDYFQEKRIRLAEDLLWRTNETVTEIAHRLGFADSAHFSRAFKAVCGISPTVYRIQRLRRMADPPSELRLGKEGVPLSVP